MDHELFTALETISDFCEYQMCYRCPFMLEKEGCILMHKTPDEWLDYLGTEGDHND